MKRAMMTCAALFAACCVGCSTTSACKDGGSCRADKGAQAHMCPDCKDGKMCEKCAAEGQAKACPDCKDGKMCAACKAKQG